MATGIHWSTAQPTRGAAGTNDVVADGDERCDLCSRESETGGGGVELEPAGKIVIDVVIEVGHLFGNDDQTVIVLFVGDGEPAHDPLHLHLRRRNR